MIRSENSPGRLSQARPALPPLPDNPIVAAAVQVVRRLKEAGHEAFFVGGFVRDWLLGIEHYDVDIATSAEPGAVEAIFESARSVGAKFGVMLIIMRPSGVQTAPLE